MLRESKLLKEELTRFTKIVIYHFILIHTCSFFLLIIYLQQKLSLMKKYIFCVSFCGLSFATKSVAQLTPVLPAKTAGSITLKTPVGVIGQTQVIKSGNILVTIDTTIRSNPKNPKPNGMMAYLSIDFSGLLGSSQMEFQAGKQTFAVFDKAGKPVAVNNEVLYRIKAAMENSNVCDMTVKIPYRLKTDADTYTVHYRWEGPNKDKSIDIVTTK